MLVLGLHLFGLNGDGTGGLLFTPFVEPPVNLNSVRLWNLDFVKNSWQLFANMNYGCAWAGLLAKFEHCLFGRTFIATWFCWLPANHRFPRKAILGTTAESFCTMSNILVQLNIYRQHDTHSCSLGYAMAQSRQTRLWEGRPCKGPSPHRNIESRVLGRWTV